MCNIWVVLLENKHFYFFFVLLIVEIPSSIPDWFYYILLEINSITEASHKFWGDKWLVSDSCSPNKLGESLLWPPTPKQMLIILGKVINFIFFALEEYLWKWNFNSPTHERKHTWI